jgi:hypothetical protein
MSEPAIPCSQQASRMARPAGIEPATPGLEEQWHTSEVALVPATCGATPRDLPTRFVRRVRLIAGIPRSLRFRTTL